MKIFIAYTLLFATLFLSCTSKKKSEAQSSIPFSLDKISYYKFPKQERDKAFKYRLSYTFDDGKPHRWMELDSLGKIFTDYIYQYNREGIHTSARYLEPGITKYQKELIRFKNDSTQITERIDSTRKVYYTMIDNLNKERKTFRTTFIGDETHGYDSTFYTKEGFEKRIFFTDMKGKVMNDRQFEYKAIDENGNWVSRIKIMLDTIREVHEREIIYDDHFVTGSGKYYEGLISNGDMSENVINFSKDETYFFYTRTKDWTNQIGERYKKEKGIYVKDEDFPVLEGIYNGAISPRGNRVIYTKKEDGRENIYIIEKSDNGWSEPFNLSEKSKIRGGYFKWFNDYEIYFQQNENNGDIVHAYLDHNKLEIKDRISAINTKEGTEFSPYVDRLKRFLIFTRYLEGEPSQQGFFISSNSGTTSKPIWQSPKKIEALPYGWSAQIINKNSQFIYSDGEDIYSIAVEELGIDLDF